MNRKGQIGIGAILIMAIAVIVSMVLFQQSAANVAQETSTFTLVNGSFTAPAAGQSIDLTGQELFDTPVIVNATNTTQIIAAANNFTIAEGVSTSSGVKKIILTTIAGSPYAGKPIKVSYSYGAEGYADDSGSRAVTGLILILAAVAIVAVIAYKIIEDNGDIFG